MGLLDRLLGKSAKPAPRVRGAKYTDDDWMGVVGGGGYQAAIGRVEREVVCEIRLLKNRVKPEVAVYVDGRKVGELNAKTAALMAERLHRVAPDTLRERLPGRVTAMDGGRVYGVQVARPKD